MLRDKWCHQRCYGNKLARLLVSVQFCKHCYWTYSAGSSFVVIDCEHCLLLIVSTVELLCAKDDPVQSLQARIAEYIRQKNIEENFEQAMEFNPEVFAQITMLYVNMDVGTSLTFHVSCCSLCCLM